MARPVRLRSSSHLHETVQDCKTTFVMFYSTRNVSVQGFTSIYNSLCARYSTPSTAFTKIPKEDSPELRDECGVPRDSVLELVIFKNGRKTDVIDIKDSVALERCVEHHARPSPRSEARLQLCCDHHGASVNVRGQARARPPRTRSPERLAPRARQVPLRIDPHCAAHIGPNQTVPANVTYRYSRHGRIHENPAQLVYRGQDGRPRRARSVHITRDGNRRPETTYLDWSGPLAIERTL